ncbi:hypothetical protein BH18ACT15_BH18ACT15_10650 [soil metagenome]
MLLESQEAHFASMSVIAPDPSESRKLYVDALGLPLEAAAGYDYLHSESIRGAKHFGVWPLAQEGLKGLGGVWEQSHERIVSLKR